MAQHLLQAGALVGTGDKVMNQTPPLRSVTEKIKQGDVTEGPWGGTTLENGT